MKQIGGAPITSIHPLNTAGGAIRSARWRRGAVETVAVAGSARRVEPVPSEPVSGRSRRAACSGAIASARPRGCRRRVPAPLCPALEPRLRFGRAARAWAGYVSSCPPPNLARRGRSYCVYDGAGATLPRARQIGVTHRRAAPSATVGTHIRSDRGWLGKALGAGVADYSAATEALSWGAVGV
jgi:hypothetical protein